MALQVHTCPLAWLGVMLLGCLCPSGKAQAAITITPKTLPDWTINSSYSQALTARGCLVTCTWSSSGTLPPGLSLSASTGTISGIPNATGSFSFTVTATDLTANGSQTYQVAIHAAPTIGTSSLPGGTVGTPYTQTLVVSGGTPPYAWSISSGSLPGGFALDSASGVISGTPTAAGTFTFAARVTDAASVSTNQSLSLTVTPAVTNPTITSSSPLPAGTVGAAYSQTLTASGGTPPYTWSVSAGSLPTGLSLNSASGAIAGTPAASGTSNFTVKVTDTANASATKAFSLTIAPGAATLTITSTSPLPGGTVGTAYSQTLAASGGTPPYSWSVSAGSLPTGLSLNSSSGAITGTPAASGTSNFSVKVSDAANASATRPFAITVGVGSPIPTLSITGVPGTINSAAQVPFDVVLSSAFPAAVNGQVTLSFQSSASVPRDDPAIQFSTGGRTVSFNIPAGSTHAVFPSGAAAFQTGTAAGNIQLNVTSDLPGGTASASAAVAEAVPVIQSANVAVNGSGFQVQVAGFSNSLALSNVGFHFVAKSGQTLQTSDLTVDLTSLAGQWFSSSASASFGGQFLLMVPFNVQQGAVNGLASVSVQIQNTQGASTAATAGF